MCKLFPEINKIQIPSEPFMSYKFFFYCVSKWANPFQTKTKFSRIGETLRDVTKNFLVTKILIIYLNAGQNYLYYSYLYIVLS